MAKFDAIYPNQSRSLDQKAVEFEGSQLICYGKPEPCWHCGELTDWVDTSFGARLCSEECERAKWAEYWRDTYGSQTEMPGM